MERSGLEYQTLGEPTRSLLEERRGDVIEEDMAGGCADENKDDTSHPYLYDWTRPTPVILRYPIRLVPNSITTTLYPGSIFYRGITQSAVVLSVSRSRKVPEQPTSPKGLLI